MLTIRTLLLLAFGLLIFGCARRKKAPANLADWLEHHFPGRFEIVGTYTSDPVRNLSFQVKKSVVAEKTDTLLQIQLLWDKRKPDLGLAAGEINGLFETAKREVGDARDLSAALKSAGFSKASAGCLHGEAQVLVFENPSPENRKQVLKRLKTVFSTWPAAKNYALAACFMEPSAQGTEFADIVPLAHWVRSDSWQRRNVVISLNVGTGSGFDPRSLEKAWRFNTESDRLLQWVERARPVAERWAAAHLKKQVFLLPETEYSQLDEKLGARLEFPFSERENAPVSGHIVGDFLLDTDVFENLKVTDDR